MLVGAPEPNFCSNWTSNDAAPSDDPLPHPVASYWTLRCALICGRSEYDSDGHLSASFTGLAGHPFRSSIALFKEHPLIAA